MRASTSSSTLNMPKHQASLDCLRRWLNAKVCELEECPVDLPEAFSGAWERVKYRGEGCVTVNALREEIQNPTA